MIYSHLQGGLGNQMFQFAAARSLALARKTQVVFDTSWYSQTFDEHTTHREYELDCFVLDNSIGRIGKAWADKLKIKLAHKYHEPHFHFDANFRNLPNNTFLDGYFQSEKYFATYRTQLLKDFTWCKPPVGKNKILLQEILAQPNSVSVHIRRGDYVKNPVVSKMHGQVNTVYYANAVKLILEHVPRPHFYIFSDDPDWTRQNVKFEHPATYISHNKKGAEDLRLMQSCRHAIIANSSFSWWSAWLNQNPNKVVISPQEWFGHLESNTKDLIPRGWQKI